MPTKHEQIIALLEKHDLDALLVRQVSNFAWATDGAASYINTATSYGSGTLLVTKDQRHLITNNIEAPRYQQEERLEAAGWVFHVGPLVPGDGYHPKDDQRAQAGGRPSLSQRTRPFRRVIPPSHPPGWA